MNIFILSDLHLSAKDKFAIFKWSDEMFIKELESIKEKYQVNEFILNGDIYDLYKNKFSKIEKSHSKLIAYFRQNNFRYIKGNHDIVMDEGSYSYTIVNSKGEKIHIEHGHNADFLNGTKAGRFIAIIGIRLLKMLISVPAIRNIYFETIAKGDHVNHVPRSYNTFKYIKYALKLLHSYDLIVLGHTHKLEAHKVYHSNKKKRYLNCGSCSLGRLEGIVINTETLKYLFIKENKFMMQAHSGRNFKQLEKIA